MQFEWNSDKADLNLKKHGVIEWNSDKADLNLKKHGVRKTSIPQR
jgi:uncharacterized DUF497 family protein